MVTPQHEAVGRYEVDAIFELVCWRTKIRIEAIDPVGNEAGINEVPQGHQPQPDQ